LYEDVSFTPSIVICDNVTIQQNIHLTCANSVYIGKNTAIAANVTITDIHHPYEDITLPIEKQHIIVKDVVIGEDCKIYNNVVILPGVHIGRHVTIGANSVVTHNIPDYSVAVGSPARVVKQYSFDSDDWVNC
jgi:acetyltransferase-like isoleucine patch superfamily enzyme